MKTERFVSEGKEINLRFDDNPEYLLVQPADENDLSGLDIEADEIRKKTDYPFMLAAFKVKRWNIDLSPWKAPAVFGNEGFGEGAAETLEFIENVLLPELYEKFSLSRSIPVVIGGYSLAGLFSLWAIRNSKRFRAAAAASPSVWFPNWTEFASEHIPEAECVYLSLGKKEEKTRNKVMSQVGIKIKEEYDILEKQLGAKNCILCWNEGNHFRDSFIRTAKAFSWCINRLAVSEER